MKIAKPVRDYRKLRPGNLGSDEFKHLKLLFFWPIFGLLFLFVERFYPVTDYYSVFCALDSYIPFNEFFLIPYLFWFVFLAGIHVYTALYDIEAFKKLMKFIIITYSIAVLVYLIFPTCQNLRPETFSRDNIFTRFLTWFYKFDTNTNVCPSIHVIGSVAAAITVWNTDRLRTAFQKTAAAVIALFICASTLFLKQHSILDIVFAIPVCVIGYYFSFLDINKKQRIGNFFRKIFHRAPEKAAEKGRPEELYSVASKSYHDYGGVNGSSK